MTIGNIKRREDSVKTIEMGTIQIGNVRGKIVEEISDPESAKYLFISIPFALENSRFPRGTWYLSIGITGNPWPMGMEWRLGLERCGTGYVDLCEL